MNKWVTSSFYVLSEKYATKFYLPNTLKKGYICEFCGVECGCGYDPDAVPMVITYYLSQHMKYMYVWEYYVYVCMDMSVDTFIHHSMSSL